MEIQQKISYHEFFKYFPESYFCIADFNDRENPIKHSTVIFKDGQDLLDKDDFETTKKLNQEGNSIFFTPNAVKTVEEKHTLNNFKYVNACYVDIDIAATKVCLDDDDLKLRQTEKEKLAGAIMFSPLPPSLTIETRNGFQIYWFTSCELDVFKKAQKGILQHFKPYGGDPATIKEVQLMRVPGFLHNKEPFKIKIRWDLSKVYDDGSLHFYRIDLIQNAFPYEEPEVEITVHKIGESKEVKKFNLFKHVKDNDIFTKVLAMPVLSVMQKISGTRLTGGEILQFMPEKNGKIQIRVNDKPTPNWLDTSCNMIFSQTEDGFCNPIHYAEYYGMSKNEIAIELHNLFDND